MALALPGPAETELRDYGWSLRIAIGLGFVLG